MTFLQKLDEEILHLIKEKETKQKELESKLADVRRLREEISQLSQEISEKYAIKNRILNAQK